MVDPKNVVFPLYNIYIYSRTSTTNMAPPGGFARLGTMSTVTTCDEYLQPFVVLAIMVLILRCFSIKNVFFSEVDCISCFQMQLIIECFDNVQTSVFFATSGEKINNHL